MITCLVARVMTRSMAVTEVMFSTVIPAEIFFPVEVDRTLSEAGKETTLSMVGQVMTRCLGELEMIS